jgi:hypothetical protein
MKILTVVPSIYPEKLTRMLESYYDTVKQPCIVINTEPGSITAILNDVFRQHPNFDFYHITNDDVEYKTMNWDEKLAVRGKISYGDDGLQGSNLCTFPVIDGDIVRAAGWLQMPTLNRYCGDVVWKFVGQNLDILNYVPEVKLTHHWHGQPDIVINNEDMAAFAQWLPWSFRDIARIRTSCQK